MTKEELMSAIMGLPAETQIYKINDYADLDHSDGCPLRGKNENRTNTAV